MAFAAMTALGGGGSVKHTSSSGTTHGGSGKSFISAVDQSNINNAKGVDRVYQASKYEVTADNPGAYTSSGSGSTYGGYYDMLKQIYDMNNEYNSAQVDKLNAFNAAEAQKDSETNP